MNSYFAIRSDGTLLAWGDSYDGLIGSDDSCDFKNANIMMKNAAFVTGATGVGLAIDNNRVLWGWGNDNGGRLLGNGYVKMPVRLMDHVVSASAGLLHCIALKEDGTLWGWGSNGYGQLGQGNIKGDDEIFASPVKILDDVTYAVIYGDTINYAVQADGSLMTWGSMSQEDPQWNTPVRIMAHVAQAQVAGDAYNNDLFALGQDENLYRISSENEWLSSPTLSVKKELSLSSPFDITEDHTLLNLTSEFYAGQESSESSKSQPKKVMEHVCYAASGPEAALVIKDDGSLWKLPIVSTVGKSENGSITEPTCLISSGMSVALERSQQVGANTVPAVSTAYLLQKKLI